MQALYRPAMSGLVSNRADEKPAKSGEDIVRDARKAQELNYVVCWSFPHREASVGCLGRDQSTDW